MNQEIKKSWVEALRSGRYVQIKKNLHTGSGYDVIGVLCDLHAKLTKTDWKLIDGQNKKAPQDQAYSYLGASVILPKTVIEWSGLDFMSTTITNQVGTKICLIKANDAGTPFAEMATLIENYL